MYRKARYCGPFRKIDRSREHFQNDRCTVPVCRFLFPKQKTGIVARAEINHRFSPVVCIEKYRNHKLCVVILIIYKVSESNILFIIMRVFKKLLFFIFINGISTPVIGRHVRQVLDQITISCLDFIKNLDVATRELQKAYLILYIISLIQIDDIFLLKALLIHDKPQWPIIYFHFTFSLFH